MLNRLIKSTLIVILLSSCLQLEEHKDSFFSDHKDISTREDSFNYISRNMISNDSSIEYSFSNLTGTETIVEFTLDNTRNITVSYLMDINNGEFKSVLISPDKSTTTLNPGVANYNCEVTGLYRIRVIAYNSTGRIAITYNK